MRVSCCCHVDIFCWRMAVGVVRFEGRGLTMLVLFVVGAVDEGFFGSSRGISVRYGRYMLSVSSAVPL